MTERNYYMVRAMYSREEDFRVFFENNVVAVGWCEVDFTESPDSSALRKAVYETYYSNSKTAPQVTGKHLNECERFKNIREGDYILVPYWSGIVLAEAKTGEIYDPDAAGDLCNQRRVAYHYHDGERLIIPRNELSEGLQRRLRVHGNTVSNLFEFKDEIEKLFRADSYSYSKEMQELERVQLEELKAGLLANIQQGKTNLQTGGIGLERLVCELLRCRGYEASVLPKTQFSGSADADIRAVREDEFHSAKLFVQVKHHSGVSGVEGVQQIAGVLAQPEYADYSGFFVTSAAVSEDARRLAEQRGIEVMDGEALVELIVNSMGRLSESTRRRLGISMIPRLAALS